MHVRNNVSLQTIEGSAIAVDVSGGEHLHTLFELQKAIRPDHPAIVFGDIELSYEDLDRQSDHLAHFLHANGVGRHSFVGVYMGRSHLPFVAILAALKVGAGYVPIDPAYPMDRVKWIAEDAQIDLLLVDSTTAAVGKSIDVCPLFDLEEIAATIAIEYVDAWSPVAATSQSSDVCYVIYTSGSTGRPKGVVIEHRNAIAYVRSASRAYGITPDDRIYQGFSLAFDASVEETWMALANGATLVIASSEQARCPESAARLIRDRHVTVFSTVPTFLAMIDDSLASVRTLILGGEICPAKLVERFGAGRRMFNTYGPTEATVVSTISECHAGETVPIGKPLAGYTVAVVDEHLLPVKTGEIGELLIGGAGVARGYIARPELTAERFINHHGLGRCYRSGDLVRADESGNLIFVGRADGQVKVRGFRVELAEIESVLLEQPGIKAAAVAVHDPFGACQLAAFVVPAAKHDSLDRDAIAPRCGSAWPNTWCRRF